MDDDIFYTYHSKGHFYRGYEEREYLPALEPTVIDELPEKFSKGEVEKLTSQVNMLRGQVLYLNHKLNEHLEKRKPKQKVRAIYGIEL